MLNVSGVSVRYDKAIVALESVDFEVKKGGVVALLGPNGAGKSTLMKAIAGMLPFEQGEVVEGTITFEQARIEGWSRIIEPRQVCTEMRNDTVPLR